MHLESRSVDKLPDPQKVYEGCAKGKTWSHLSIGGTDNSYISAGRQFKYGHLHARCRVLTSGTLFPSYPSIQMCMGAWLTMDASQTSVLEWFNVLLT